MKVLTHEEWMKNPTPRMMWVWDDDETCRGKLKVIYFSKQDIAYPIIVLADNDIDIGRYKHCAEIGKPKTRRMTNKEFSRWLRENPTREYKCRTSEDKDSFVYWYHSFIEYCADKEPDDNSLKGIIRRIDRMSEKIVF